MVSFFSENYYIYHYSNSCSLAFIFLVILILFTILLPFFTNFGPLEKFWLPNTIFTDHPIVQFKDEFLIELTFQNDTVRLYPSQLFNGNCLLSSSSFELQDYSNKDIINVIKYKGHIQFPDERKVKNVKFMFEGCKELLFAELQKFYIFFDYYMTDVVNIHMRSKAHLFYSSNDPFSKIISNSALILKQNKAMTETYFLQEETKNSELEEEIRQIVDLMLQDTKKALADKNITMSLTDEAKKWLLLKGTDLKYGARPLRRAIQKFVEDEIAERILTGEFSNGKTVKVSLSEDKLVFEAE